MKFCGTKTCDQCPWRKDVEPGRFPPERFEALRNTVGDGDDFRPLFACHKTADGQETACVGYLIVEGWTNIVVRLAAARGRVNLDALEASGPLYENYEAMAEANGV